MEEQKKWITLETAARIRHFRRINSLSQEELALRANLNPAYLGQVERGLKCPTIDTLYKISNALGVSLSELLNFDNSFEFGDSALNRIKLLLACVPERKTEQILKLLEDLLLLLTM